MKPKTYPAQSDSETPEARKGRIAAKVQETASWDSFERGFSDHTGSCAGKCDCGRQFYNPDNGWQFDKGELELYQAEGATALSYAVSFVTFEGRLFVVDCDCWHERALRIIGFIEHHAHAIAEFLSLEKRRKQTEAAHSPVVVP